MMGAAESEKKRAELLQKAVKLKPDFQEANYHLGFTLYRLGDYQGAHDALTRVKRITPEQAPQFFQALAHCDDRLGLPDLAKAAARQALDYARTPADSEAARQLMEYVSRLRGQEGTAQPATASLQALGKELPTTVRVLRLPQELYRAEGMLIQVDCLGEGARLWMMSGDKKLAFVIANRKGVIVERGGQQTEHEFTCGAQQPQKVLIQYEKKPDAGLVAEGAIRVLEFQ
jgi:tetratricopeptide (TPR) repeat protein